MRRSALAVALLLLAAFPAHASEEAPPADVELGRYRTTYLDDPEHKNRAFNVELASQAIDDKEIAPGAVLSFNGMVGERTAAFGFAKAVVLRDRMIAEGTGGGTCQVASTLHAAALLAGLEIAYRAPHTRPSGYIRMGLDATVAFPKIDLKIKNPTPSPIRVHARARGGNLDVWVSARGAEARRKVTLTTEIVERARFERTVERERSLAGDEVQVVAFGIPGFTVRRTRVITLADGSLRRDARVDVYPPTSQVLRVAPAFDLARLAKAASSEDDEDEAPPVAIRRTIAPGAVRPLPVQLRPSTTVTIDNGG